MTEEKQLEPATPAENMPAWREVFLYFLMLGFINIGGPVAQITMMFNHMVERRAWLSKDRFVSIMAFCHMLPGPEALQLAIYVGYIKRGILAGIAAGVTFIVPGALVMILLSWLYVEYGSLPQVNNALYILKPAVLGIIGAGIIKLGTASIKTPMLGLLLVGAFVGMRFAGMNLLLVLVVAGVLNLLFVIRPQSLRSTSASAGFITGGGFIVLGFFDEKFLQLAWLFLKTGLFSFGGAYASLAFLQQGAVENHHWLTSGQFLDGVAMSVATPGPFMLFATFVGYMAAGIPGAIIGTVFVFLPSFVFVLLGARYVEQVRNNRPVQAFLAGVSAAVVGVILVVSLDLAREAIVGIASLVIAAISFVSIVVFKVDVAKLAAGAIVCGILYAGVRALL
ncbi:MAG: chromate efflux transporter [Blastocatellia bacterium]